MRDRAKRLMTFQMPKQLNYIELNGIKSELVIVEAEV